MTYSVGSNELGLSVSIGSAKGLPLLRQQLCGHLHRAGGEGFAAARKSGKASSQPTVLGVLSAHYFEFGEREY
jgi:hypothetical protein